MSTLDPLFERMLNQALPARNLKGEPFLQFRCSIHGLDRGDYSAPPPTNDCEQCWFMYYMKLNDVTPVGKRGEMADKLATAAFNADQDSRAGKWDVEIYKVSKHTPVET